MGAFGVVGCAARPTPPPDSPRLVLAKSVPAEEASQDAPRAAATAPLPPPPAANYGDPVARTHGWIIVGLGAQAGAVAIATSVMMLHQSSVRDRECDAQKVCSQAGLDANTKLHSLAGWNAGAWTLAAVGLGVGAFIVITNPRESAAPRTAVGLAPNGSGLGLDVRSQF